MKNKIVNRPKAEKICEKLRSQRKKIVFTNGCFDLLHVGHAEYLYKAKKLGDFLIVGLNTDSSVRKMKGNNRPLITFKDRALLLAHLISVDLVVDFREITPLNLINALKPDILVKGADYEISEIVGASEVRAWGGKVRRIKLIPGKSTSALIKKINKLR
jgi:D-beta-D-heptose 7-phosphate kinase/D-beta-D-heptose 1-phosphate adenosyltransferase